MGLPTFKKQKLGRKSQDKNDKIKQKMHTDDRNRNYWIFQLHWNKLKWINPRSKI